MLTLERQNALREEYRRLNPLWQPATEAFAQQVRDHLEQDARVLDLGCGRGGLVEQLGHPLSLVAGIDPDLQSLREHRLELARAAAVCEHLPLAPASFDMVYASWLLEHLERPLLAFSAVARVLKPGGVFVFITPNGRHPLASFNQLFGRFSRLQKSTVKRLYGRSGEDTFTTYYRANTVRALSRLCHDSDMRLVDCQAINDPTYLAFTPTLFRLAIWLDARLPDRRNMHLVGLARRDP